jgi:hypothetical protein
MQERDVAPLGDRLQPPPQGGVAARPGKQAARQRAEVEAGPAREDRQASARVDVADRGRRVARILRRRVVVGRFGDVDQMVRDPAAIASRNLVRADVEPRYTAVESQLMISPA